MNETLKRYLVSSLITFCTVFFSTVGVLLAQGTITPDNLSLVAAWGVCGAALRAAFKAVFEIIPTFFVKK